MDDLIENAKLIADAVANAWHFDGCERIHVTRRESPEAPVAEAGLFFLRKDVIEVITERPQCFTRLLGDAKIEEIVRKVRAG